MARSLTTNLIGLAVIGGALYYTGGGAWIMTQTKTLSGNCYTSLYNLGGASVAQPLCAGIANGVAFVDRTSGLVGKAVGSVSALILSSEQGMRGIVDAFARQSQSLASPPLELRRLLSAGPYNNAATPDAQFKLAMDSFAIASDYMKSRTSSELAIPWLQVGAAQPQGYGMMSQLALGQLYSVPGVGRPEDVGLARYHYERAQQSLYMLTQSQDPRARQILSSLPVAPGVLNQQIEQAMRDLSFQVR